MDDALLPTLLRIAAIVGAGLVTGLLFAFSAGVMRALAQLPPEQGLAAMQRINEAIPNPLFLLPFFGTAVLCALIALLAAGELSSAAARWQLLGALAYGVGPFGITIARNVPLNRRLAQATAADAPAVWPRYVERWLFWNHLRTALGAVAIGALAAGLLR